jgi:hypothetical protein
MTTLANIGTVVVHTTPAQTRRRTLLVSLARIAVIVGVASGFAYGQADRAMTMLQSFLLGNRLSAADIEMLYVLSAALAPGVLGLLLASFALGLRDDGKQ